VHPWSINADRLLNEWLAMTWTGKFSSTRHGVASPVGRCTAICEAATSGRRSLASSMDDARSRHAGSPQMLWQPACCTQRHPSIEAKDLRSTLNPHRYACSQEVLHEEVGPSSLFRQCLPPYSGGRTFTDTSRSDATGSGAL
jgi:hypothetical protein